MNVADETRTITTLRERLARYPSDRFPVQHATAQFHLGVTLTNGGQLDEAERALMVAVQVFGEGLPLEFAKSLNALGAVLRAQGRLDEAAQTFRRAGEGFERTGHALEQGATLFNLGLVLNETGDPQEALESLERARELLDVREVPGQWAAACRELGATLLTLNRPAQARTMLEEAVDLAARAGDQPGLGAAENALGLVYLASGNVDEAADALHRAAAANPKTLREEGYAMAKANLALAYEQAGDAARARLAALQALDAPDAPPPVVSQAAEVLDRLGRTPGDLVTVLSSEDPDRWDGIVRDELARWVDIDDERLYSEAGAWIDGQPARSGTDIELAKVLLGGLLELPPWAMDRVVRALLDALSETDPEARRHFRTLISRAMIQFHEPQRLRLESRFNAIASDLGQDGGWQ